MRKYPLSHLVQAVQEAQSVRLERVIFVRSPITMVSICMATMGLSLSSAYAHEPINEPTFAHTTILANDAAANSASNNNATSNTVTPQTTNPNTRAAHTTFDPIVVTATRSNRVLSDAPVPVQVLSQADLKENHAHTLKQALALLPNVYLREIHGKTGYEVLMQGFSGDQVLVLIDGLPITASTGSTVNLNQYLNVDVEQIEVIQGAASAQYGSSAMGGVINVITKPIADSKAHLTAEIGSNGRQNPSDKVLDANRRFVEGSFEGALDRDGHVRARLSGSYLDDAGLSLDHTAWPRLKDASEQAQVSARVTYNANVNSADQNGTSANKPNQLLSDTQLWAEASHYTENDTQRFNYYVAPRYLPQQKDEQITKQRFSAGARTTIAPSKNPDHVYQLSASALYEDYQSESDTFSQGLVTSSRDADITTALVGAQLDLPIWLSSNPETLQSHQVQVGGQWQQDTLSQTKSGVSELISSEVSRDVAEVYLQDDWLIGDNWEVLSGVRYQDDTDFGGHAAPKVSIKYNHNDAQGRPHILRGSIGNGYRVPNLKERYYVFDHSNLGYKVMGNPDLQPETSTSYQLGYSGQISEQLSLTVNGFYNDIEDLIQTDEDNASYEGNIAIYKYENVDNAQTYGGDIALDWRATDTATLKAGYTYTKTHNDSTGGELTRRPQHQAQLALDYQLSPKIQLIEQLNYEGKQLISTTDNAYSPSWWTLDSKVNYQLNNQLGIYAGVNNIFDVQREPSEGTDFRPLDNREWLLGANYQW